MAWREITVDVEDVAATLNAVATGTQPPWLLDTGSIDPASLFIDVFGELDGSSVRQRAYMLFDFSSGGADPGWSASIVDYGSVASVMGGVTLATLTREVFGVRRGRTFKRRMLLVWK